MAEKKENIKKRDTVLIIDDDPEIRITFFHFLEMQNYRVITLPDHKKLFETLEKENVDLIILDIMFPEKSGMNILADLKASNRFNHIPVIMFTAKDEDTTLKKAFELGANDFITKPIKSLTELAARIKANIKIKKYEDELRKIAFLTDKLEILKQVMVTIEHNFGQPLTVILSYISILERDIKNNPDLYAKYSPILSKIKNSVGEIQGIVENLKSVNKIEITEYVNSIKMIKIKDTKKSRE